MPGAVLSPLVGPNPWCPFEPPRTPRKNRTPFTTLGSRNGIHLLATLDSGIRIFGAVKKPYR